MNVPQKNEKRKFDKRKFLKDKFNKKLRVQQWEEKRKLYVQRKYKKELKKIQKDTEYPKHESNNSIEGISSESTIPENKKTPVPEKRKRTMKDALAEIERRKEEIKNKRLEQMRKKEEIKEAMERYKKKKAENFKKLSKKTKRGQPIMKDRLKLLYEQVQQRVLEDSST